MNNLLITARSQDSRLLDDSVRTVLETAKRFGVSVSGPIPLPTRNSRDSKDSDRRTCIFGRVLRLVDPTPGLMSELKGTALSQNVSFTLKQEG